MGERLCWSDGMGWDEQTESVYSLQYLKCLERCRRDQGCLDQTSPVMVGEPKSYLECDGKRHSLQSQSTSLISSPATDRRERERERERCSLCLPESESVSRLVVSQAQPYSKHSALTGSQLSNTNHHHLPISVRRTHWNFLLWGRISLLVISGGYYLFLRPQSAVVNPVKSIINTNIRMTEESVNSDLPRHSTALGSSVHTLLIRKLSLIYISTNTNYSQRVVRRQSKLNYADND